jgi:hypothetical protein
VIVTGNDRVGMRSSPAEALGLEGVEDPAPFS